MAKVKKTQSNKSEDVHQAIRHIGVLIEAVNDNVALVAEQYGDIKKTLDVHTKILDSHTAILDSHTAILDSHTERLDSHTAILDSHTERLDSHTEMIGRLAVNLEIVKEDVGSIKNGLKKKVDGEEFSALERRVTVLEKRR